MSEPLPEGVTRKDFDELKSTVAALADALKARDEADTAAATQAAQQDVKEARADLDTLAKELGIPVASLREAAEAAKKQARKDELRPILLELLDEELSDPPAEEETPGDDEPPADAEEDDNPEDDPPPVEDSAPTQAHWSERSLVEILKR